MMSLRLRLFLSYLLLLVVTLGVIAVTIVLLLAAQPASPTPSYQRLMGVAQGFGWRDLISLREGSQGGLIGLGGLRGDGGLSEADLNAALNTIYINLQTFADQSSVRLLVVNTRSDVALFDSAGTLTNVTVVADLESLSPSGMMMMNVPGETLLGRFNDPSVGEYVFAGFEIPAQRVDAALLFAELSPQRTFADTVSEFASTMALPLAQAGVLGTVVAAVLAALISQNIARPLQTVASASVAIAEGHLEQRVPVSGPPEVRSVAEAFNHMSAQVRATQQAQQDFLANVSHDLKTPLTSIQGYSQAIMDGAARDPAAAARIIHEEAARLNRMVIELTDLARLEAGRLSMRSGAIDIGQIASAVVQRLMVLAQSKGLDFQSHTPSCAPIAGDGDRLAQVVTNLISNAIKYTPEGGDVRVITREHRGGVELIVKDSGVGIAQTDLPRVFERFYQVDKARGPERGTGLGLAITREIVHAHGGEITVASAGPGLGTTFSVWLPSPQMSTMIRGKR